MLTAFIDDSGSGGDSTWYVLAGYIATAEAWNSFDKPWREILNGLPKLEYFKASQAESLRSDGQWAGITPEQRNRRLDSFIDVIRNHASRAIYVRTKQQDFNEVIKPFVPPMWDNAYFFLFIALIAAATSLEKYTASSRPIDFVFDTACKKRIVSPSLMLYDQVAMWPQFTGRIHNVHYEDEKNWLPLQASDLLAWQIRRRFSVEGDPRKQFETAINAAAEPPFECLVSREDLELYGRLMDNDAKSKWANMGLPEEQRKWRRPKNEI